MADYDSTLIFDLAAGRLPEREARAAEAALSPEGRAELAAQRAVLSAIGEAPAPQMTDIERARMHRTVAQRIADATREMAAVPATVRPAPRRRRSVVWMRFASAAAAAAMFVGVVAVGSQFVGDGDSDATADTIGRSATTAFAAGGDALTTTTAAAAGLVMGDGQFESNAADPSGGDARAEAMPIEDGDLSMLEEAPALTAPPSESDLDGLEDFAQEILRTRRFDDALESLPCFDVAREDDDLEIAASFRVPYPGEDGEELEAIAFTDAGTPTSDSLVRLYDPVTCEPLADTTDPQ
jgi:hypothetical protein